MRWTWCADGRSGAQADERNRVVLIPRRWDQVSDDEFEATEANKPGTPGRARISRKPLRRECRCSGVPVAFLFYPSRGCDEHPALPAPS